MMNSSRKQAVAELCQAQFQFRLDSDFLGEDQYIIIFKKTDQEIKRFKQAKLIKTNIQDEHST